MLGFDREVAKRRTDAEGRVLESRDEQEEAEVENLVLAVGPALDIAAQEQRDQVVAAGVGAAVDDLRGQEAVERVGGGADLLPARAVDAAVDERVGPAPRTPRRCSMPSRRVISSIGSGLHSVS